MQAMEHIYAIYTYKASSGNILQLGYLHHQILNIFLTTATNFSSVGGFLWLPGCKNFLIVGMLLILPLKAYKKQQ